MADPNGERRGAWWWITPQLLLQLGAIAAVFYANYVLQGAQVGQLSKDITRLETRIDAVAAIASARSDANSARLNSLALDGAALKERVEALRDVVIQMRRQGALDAPSLQ